MNKFEKLVAGATMLGLSITNPASAEKVDDDTAYKYTMQNVAAVTLSGIAYASSQSICPTEKTALALTRGIVKLRRLKTKDGIKLVPDSGIVGSIPSLNVDEDKKGIDSGASTVNLWDAWSVETLCLDINGNTVKTTDEQRKMFMPAYHTALLGAVSMQAQMYSDKKIPKHELYLRFVIKILYTPKPKNPSVRSITIFDSLKIKSLKQLVERGKKRSKDFYDIATIGEMGFVDYTLEGYRIIEPSAANIGITAEYPRANKLPYDFGPASWKFYQQRKETFDPKWKNKILKLEKKVQNMSFPYNNK